MAKRVVVDRVLWTLAAGLLVLAVPCALVGFSVNSLIYDPDYYARGQARYAVGRTTEYTLEALRPINDALVRFFSSPGVSLPTSLADAGADRAVFNAREVGHMDDVRELVWSLGRLQNLALAVVVAGLAGRYATSGRRGIAWAARWLVVGAVVTIVVVAGLGLLSLVDFAQLFLTFHVLSFDNDLWQLDPRRDNLIRFFPFEFWFDATVTVAVRTVLSAVLVVVTGWVLWTWGRGGRERAVP